MGRVDQEQIKDIRIVLGSVAPIVIRCMQTEKALRGKNSTTKPSIGRHESVREISPIDDIRSTAKYRLQVAKNLLTDFPDNFKLNPDVPQMPHTRNSSFVLRNTLRSDRDDFRKPIAARAQREESFEGFVSGLRANAVKGHVTYQRKDGKFDLEAGLKLEEGDTIKTGSESYAELLLQPGNYLRIGGETEFQIFSEPHDKMRLKLNQGAITFEILSRENEEFTSFYYTRANYMNSSA